MRRSILIVMIILLVVIGIGLLHQLQNQREAIVATQELKRFVENSYSENPSSGLPHDWLDCLERYQTPEEKSAKRMVCTSRTIGGVTSTLYALRLNGEQVPVIETHLSDIEESRRVIIDIVGGPGGAPFRVKPAMPDELLKRIRESDLGQNAQQDVKQSPYFQLLERGFTIASIGYWGTNIRTLQEPNEIELAFRDVRLVINDYRDQIGFEPPLLTVSLGNHIALGALGKDRLEKMELLALVPIMYGLQHHTRRFSRELASERAAVEDKDKLVGQWSWFNIYKKTDESFEFDHSRMLPLHEYLPTYLEGTDIPWNDVQPKAACSKIILGAKDPRTEDYLASNTDLPTFVDVWNADHDLFVDAPEKSRAAFADFAECLVQSNQ